MNSTPSLSYAIRPAGPGDFDRVQSLLVNAHLGTEDLADHFENFFVAEIDATLVGTIGLELYGEDALLRSAAVAEEHRGKGIGEMLVATLTAFARQRGVKRFVLLTTTAERFFASRGFVRISRDAIQGDILISSQFRYACPASAAVMVRSIEDDIRGRR